MPAGTDPADLAELTRREVPLIQREIELTERHRRAEWSATLRTLVVCACYAGLHAVAVTALLIERDRLTPAQLIGLVMGIVVGLTGFDLFMRRWGWVAVRGPRARHPGARSRGA